jgi:hypothetical protein
MLLRALSVSWLCLAALGLHAQEPFDVSLGTSSADLSPHYRSLIRHATERYRGDVTGQMITARMHSIQGPEFESEEINDYLRGTTDFYLRRRLEGRPISEAHFISDPFASELPPFSIAVGVDTRASNQTMQLTAFHTAFTFCDD